ncbi:Putative uncharacterized transposon-derived protein [Frankliniella fusca]|uniref:Uncharacterized transposon-derived protein n=1 Tax=Frankliniella fusca TaxID=407009 RepID=A0AAE1GUC2_9NEOP|nr:Putative uncharacterized transposon-derived protein [Frankliniella fusca]
MPGNLGDVYHEPADPASYGTVWKLWDATGEKKDKITEYLQGEDAYTLHKPARHRFPRNVTYAGNIDESWQTDLTDFQSLKKDNDGFSYILCVIDVFSKFAWAVPIKDNSASSIIKGFQLIFKTTHRRPTRMFSDKGKEYINKTFQKFLKENNITYIHTHNPDIKCSVVERWQRTIKPKLFKRFTHTEQYRYVDVLLDDIVDAYNHTYHRAIKMRPEDVTPDRVLESRNNCAEGRTRADTRADYRQLLELVVIFLGENPFNPQPIHFSPPIAVSSVRFMARVICCLMIQIFALTGEFEVDPTQLANIREQNLFFVSSYLKPWYTATHVTSAPQTDLNLMKAILTYEQSKKVPEVAANVFKNHLWNQLSVTVGMAFFDPAVPNEEKIKMRTNLELPVPKAVSPWKRFVLPRGNELDCLLECSVSSFVNSIIRIGTDFLKDDPSTWHQHVQYQDGLVKVNALEIVNDVAERGVALVKRFSHNPITRKEARFQDLMLVRD